MSVVSELGGVREIEWRGRTIHAKLIDQDVQGQYERWLFRRACDVAKEMRDLRTPEEHAARLKELEGQFADGEFQLLSKAGMGSMNMREGEQRIPPGMLKLCSLLFGVSSNDVIGLVTECREEVLRLINQIIKESFPSINAGDGTGEGKA